MKYTVTISFYFFSDHIYTTFSSKSVILTGNSVQWIIDKVNYRDVLHEEEVWVSIQNGLNPVHTDTSFLYSSNVYFGNMTMISSKVGWRLTSNNTALLNFVFSVCLYSYANMNKATDFIFLILY